MKKIAIGSVKGGVGKSTVSFGLATTFARMGYRVGMIGADLEGDALGYMAGLSFDKFSGDELIEPIDVWGVKMISLSLIVEPEWLDSPIMLKEETTHDVIRQLFEAVNFGELDILCIDSPPTSGAELQAIARRLRPDGFIIVTIPQKLAEIPVQRMIRAVRDELGVAIWGIVENNAYNSGGNAGENISAKTGIPLLGKIPWDRSIAEAMDEGRVLRSDYFGPIAEAIEREYLKEEGDIRAKVMRLHEEGKTMPQIARELGISRGKALSIFRGLRREADIGG
ncbi:MAG: P-loop NTPase [Deltaproteobacteria bacterium]|nr:P-loop NTPase [Deltaproteobacteria bacterium]